MAMAHRSLKRRREALPPSDSVEEATPFEEEEEVAKERMKKKMPFFFLLVLFLSGGRFHATGLATKSIMDFESKKNPCFGFLRSPQNFSALKSGTAHYRLFSDFLELWETLTLSHS